MSFFNVPGEILTIEQLIAALAEEAHVTPQMVRDANLTRDQLITRYKNLTKMETVKIELKNMTQEQKYRITKTSGVPSAIRLQIENALRRHGNTGYISDRGIVSIVKRQKALRQRYNPINS